MKRQRDNSGKGDDNHSVCFADKHDMNMMEQGPEAEEDDEVSFLFEHQCFLIELEDDGTQ